MIVFLVFSVLGGIVCAGISLLGFGAGFWIAALWYVLGAWAGFAISVAAFLLTEQRHKSGQTTMHTEFG